MNNQLQKANSAGALIVSQVDKEAMKNLIPAEKKIIEAALQPKINQQPALTVVQDFVTLITAAYTRAGFKMPDATTVALYADEFYNELLERYPNVTLAEVKEA